MYNNSDATVIPTGGGSDPWATNLATYGSGTAGNLVYTNLDAKVSTRSTYAGGAVASVTAPVIVGTNQDKGGYSVSTLLDKSGVSLASNGLDLIMIESNINLRQSMSPILAAAGGVLTGAGTGTIVIKGGNTATTRITATTDNYGNRTSVNLVLPS